MNHVNFHIARNFATLSEFARNLYGDTENASARDFLRINRAAGGDGHVWPGDFLFLPEPECYVPELEAEVIKLVRHFNHRGPGSLTVPERQLMAKNPNLVDNAAKEPGLLQETAKLANTFASGIAGALGLQTRLMSDSLRKLEAEYVREFEKHGELTSGFYAKRQRIYSALDTALGRASRILSMGTPYSQSAKTALRINSKSQILHWKHHGTEGGIQSFKTHFGRMQNISRYLKGGGYLTVGIDGYFTYDTIADACQSGNERECSRAKIVEGGGFGGRVAGGALGGIGAYAFCNAAFAAPSLGSSFLWCGIVAGAAGGMAGGAALGAAAQYGGRTIFQTAFPARSQ